MDRLGPAALWRRSIAAQQGGGHGRIEGQVEAQIEALPPLSNPPPSPLSAGKSRALSGRVLVPGDKSISHRALMFGALAA